jgi:AcrR family transcriptional regulator
MGSRQRRTRERAETRQKILDAARDMFVAEGYEATTMRAIAERVEYTPAGLYHHFPGKEALLTELCSTDFRDLAAAFHRIGGIQDPVERLRQIGVTYVDFALEHPMQYQLMFMTRHPSVLQKNLRRGDPTEDAYAFLRQTCADVIATGNVRPEFTDPDQLAQMVWAGMHGLLALHIVKRNGDDWIEWRDARTTSSRICEAMLHGIITRP